MTTTTTTRSLLAALAASLLAACGSASNAPAPLAAQAAAVEVAAYGITGASVVKAQAGDTVALLAPDGQGAYVGTLSVAPGEQDVTVTAFADENSDGRLEILAASTTTVEARLDKPAAVHAHVRRHAREAGAVNAVNLDDADPVAGAWVPFTVDAKNADGSPSYVLWAPAEGCEIDFRFADASRTHGKLRFESAGACTFSVWGWSAPSGWEELKMTVDVR